jgi:hypothetical protein
MSNRDIEPTRSVPPATLAAPCDPMTHHSGTSPREKWLVWRVDRPSDGSWAVLTLQQGSKTLASPLEGQPAARHALSKSAYCLTAPRSALPPIAGSGRPPAILLGTVAHMGSSPSGYGSSTNRTPKGKPR